MTMKPINPKPLPTLCCEMNPLMTVTHERVDPGDGSPSYYKEIPTVCRFCGHQVCAACWKSGKHFIKNFVQGVEGPEVDWIALKEFKRDIPQCINPWLVVLQKVRAKL